MVTGKRDLLSDEAKEVIREAGIFHIITISGVQMTLVAAIFFVGLRRLLALSQTLALSYPIKKWAALFAIAGAIFYDIATGSRVGTERALFMTLIMLTSVVLDRQALTMRNLAIAAALVILIQPEAIMGASFQLSFAAVAALVAVYEARVAAWGRDEPLGKASRPVEGERKRMALETLKPLLLRLEIFPGLIRNQAHAAAVRGQASVGIVNAQVQAELGPRGEHAIGLVGSLGDQVVDQDGGVPFGTRYDHRIASA